MTELQDRRLFGARSRTARIVRNSLLRAGDHSGILEHQLMPDLAQVRLRYKGSPLNVAADRRGERAFAPGRRLPDIALPAADGSGEIPLRDACRGATITIVVAAGRGAAARVHALERLAARYGPAVTLCGPLVPEPRSGGWVIGVRPDGYVGYRGPCAVTPSLRGWLDTLVASPDVARTPRRSHPESSSTWVSG